jgi:hypothetical protein
MPKVWICLQPQIQKVNVWARQPWNIYFLKEGSTKHHGRQKYLIFAGKKDTSGNVKATGDPLDDVNGFEAQFESRKATFTFQELKTPYVILLKSGPIDDICKGYFAKIAAPQ